MPKEAELICLVKDKKISKRWKITKQCVEEAFPQIVWEDAADEL